MMETNYLEHHGILGQRWGVRRFQNYDGTLKHPKGDSGSSGTKKTAQTKSSNSASNSESSSQSSQKKVLTDRQKRNLKIGAAVCGALVVGGVTVYAVKTGKLDKPLQIGKAKVDRLLGRNKGAGGLLDDGTLDKICKESGLKRNSTPVSIIDSTAKVNPGFKTGDPAYRHNCFSSVTADLCNRLGIDAKARAPRAGEETGINFVKLLKPFKGSSVDDIIIPKNHTNAKEEFSKQILEKCKGSDSAYGYLRVKRAADSKAGHYMKWEVKNGECFISDSMSGSLSNADKYFKAITSGQISRAVEIARLDGLEIDPIALKDLLA